MSEEQMAKKERLERAARARAFLEIGDETTVENSSARERGRVRDPQPARSDGGDQVGAEAPRRVEQAHAPASVREADGGPPRAVLQEIDPRHYPRKHGPGALKRGDSVWYRGERFWVEFVPSTWDKGCYARISDKRIDPNPVVPSGTDLCYVDEKGRGHGHVVSFCVHADMLALAPQASNPYGPQPTLAGIARKERTARGERDVGDPIAVKLREGKTLDDVYRIGAEFLGIPEVELRAKYGHLNTGQQRMNIGNRMRSKWKKDQR